MGFPGERTGGAGAGEPRVHGDRAPERTSQNQARPDQQAPETPDKGDGRSREPSSAPGRRSGRQQREDARVPPRPERPNLQLGALCAGRPPGAPGPDNERGGGRRPPLPAGPA